MSSHRAVQCVSKCAHVYIHTYVCMCVRCVQLFITYSGLLCAVVVDAVLVVALCIHVTDCQCVQSLNSTYIACSS